MTRNVTLAAALVVAVALVAAPVAAATGAFPASADQATGTPPADENATVQPGERLSGVVGVQQAEVEGEVEERTFGVKVAKANSDGAKADVVAEQLDSTERRLTELEQRKQELQRARENGEIGEGEYRAEVAEVNARTENVKRMANASEATARGLPEHVLAERGINVTAIQTLRDRAGELSGPETAEIARSIAGKDVGKSMAGANKPDEVASKVPDGVGPGADGNRTAGPDDGPGGNSVTGDGADDPGDGRAGNSTDATDDPGRQGGTDLARLADGA